MKKIILLTAFVLSLGTAFGQANPCNGGVVGRQAGRTDWGPFECTTVTISQDRYEELRLGEEQMKDVRSQLIGVYALTKENLNLRDSLIITQRRYQMDLETIRERTAELNRKNEQLAEDALRNSEYCERRLTLSKSRAWLYGIGGAVGGALVGLLVGKNLQ